MVGATVRISKFILKGCNTINIPADAIIARTGPIAVEQSIKDEAYALIYPPSVETSIRVGKERRHSLVTLTAEVIGVGMYSVFIFNIS